MGTSLYSAETASSGYNKTGTQNCYKWIFLLKMKKKRAPGKAGATIGASLLGTPRNPQVTNPPIL